MKNIFIELKCLMLKIVAKKDSNNYAPTQYFSMHLDFYYNTK